MKPVKQNRQKAEANRGSKFKQTERVQGTHKPLVASSNLAAATPNCLTKLLNTTSLTELAELSNLSKSYSSRLEIGRPTLATAFGPLPGI